MDKLPISDVITKIQSMSGWTVEEERWLVKKFRFRAFLQSIDFVNQIATLSEEENHHPFINIEYKVVTLRLTSWRAGGITSLDLQLIEKYDALYEQMSESAQ